MSGLAVKLSSCMMLMAVGLGAGQAIAAPPTTPRATAVLPSAATLERPSEAEALAFVQAYSPSHLRRAAELALLEKSFVAGLRRDPSAVDLLEAFPALGGALTAAMASQIDVYMIEYDERFFPRASAVVQQSMSRSDVATLTAFYVSPLGRKILETAAQKLDGSEVIDRALAGKEIDAGVAKRQALRAGLASVGALSSEERVEVLALASSPAGRSFRTIMPQLTALQVELTNNPGPRFSAGSKHAMGAAFKRVTGVDPFAKN